jgi:hypothetical protein
MKGRASPLLLLASAVLASAAETTDPTATRPRAVSPQTAARINASLPRFAPPAAAERSVPAPLASSTSTSSPDFGDTAPDNDVVRLPRYEVRERPLPQIRERNLLTRAGRLDLAVKRHPALKLGPLSAWNLRRGLEMLEEEQQIERNREMSELVGLQRTIAAVRSRPATPVRVAAE